MAFHSGKPRKGAHLIKTDKKKAEKTAAALPRKRRIPAALIVILVLLVLLAGGALGAVYFYPNIFPGVTVGSIDVGGLSRDEAAQQIAIKSKPLYQGKKLTLTIYDADYDIPVENVLSGVDDIQSAENAWKVGREGGPLARMTAIISAMRNGCDTRLDASVDESGLKAQLEEIAAEALTEPVAPTWKLDGENLVIQSGTPGVQFDTAAVEQALTAQIELMDFKPYEVSTDVTAAPAIDIDKIAEDVTGSPVNATVSKEDGKTIIAGKAGVSFDTDKAKVRAKCYDLVLNGIELSSGSIRITDPELQQHMFEMLGMTDEEINAKFGFLVDAYKYGAPPHGGAGIGLDRLAMLMCGCDSLRDVTAFPKVQNASELMSEAPSTVSEEQLKELGIAIVNSEE